MLATSNQFLKGLNSDMHPLTTSQQEYTDALNATLITFNGNEQMLQNDMGNTKIQDSKTGNIMGLREGFIPVGVKEHGGIIYIASVNKEGVGEIGTIPSPVIWYDESGIYKTGKTSDKASGLPDSIEYIFDTTKSKNLLKLTTELLHVGDRFIPIIRFGEGLKDTFDYTLNNGSVYETALPLFSYYLYDTVHNEFIEIKGLYKPKLYTLTKDQIIDITDSVSNRVFNFGDTIEKYWFKLCEQTTDLVLINLTTQSITDNSDKVDGFIHYPNVSPGYPCIGFEKENIETFLIFKNHNSGKNYPLVARKPNDGDTEFPYKIYFPGFEYSTTSSVRINKIVCRVLYNGELIKLFKYNSTEAKTELSFETTDDSIILRRKGDYKHLIMRNDLTDQNTTPDNDVSLASWINSNSSTPKYIDKSLFYIDVPDNDLNKWYTLEVDYYGNYLDSESYIDTYMLQFNPYLTDILKCFTTVDFIEGADWADLYYEPNNAADGELSYESTHTIDHVEQSPIVTKLLSISSIASNFKSNNDGDTNKNKIELDSINARFLGPDMSKLSYLYLSKEYNDLQAQDLLYKLEYSVDNINFALKIAKSLKTKTTSDSYDTSTEGQVNSFITVFVQDDTDSTKYLEFKTIDTKYFYANDVPYQPLSGDYQTHLFSAIHVNGSTNFENSPNYKHSDKVNVAVSYGWNGNNATEGKSWYRLVSSGSNDIWEWYTQKNSEPVITASSGSASLPISFKISMYYKANYSYTLETKYQIMPLYNMLVLVEEGSDKVTYKGGYTKVDSTWVPTACNLDLSQNYFKVGAVEDDNYNNANDVFGGKWQWYRGGGNADNNKNMKSYAKTLSIDPEKFGYFYAEGIDYDDSNDFKNLIGNITENWLKVCRFKNAETAIYFDPGWYFINYNAPLSGFWNSGGGLGCYGMTLKVVDQITNQEEFINFGKSYSKENGVITSSINNCLKVIYSKNPFYILNKYYTTNGSSGPLVYNSIGMYKIDIELTKDSNVKNRLLNPGFDQDLNIISEDWYLYAIPQYTMVFREFGNSEKCIDNTYNQLAVLNNATDITSIGASEFTTSCGICSLYGYQVTGSQYDIHPSLEGKGPNCAYGKDVNTIDNNLNFQILDGRLITNKPYKRDRQ